MSPGKSKKGFRFITEGLSCSVDNTHDRNTSGGFVKECFQENTEIIQFNCQWQIQGGAVWGNSP